MFISTQRVSVWMWPMVLIGILLLGGPDLALAQDQGPPSPMTVAQLVQRAVARHGAVVSGQMSLAQIVFNTAGEVIASKKESFSFSGKSWAVCPDGTDEPNEVSHDGKYVRRFDIPQRNGRISHTARVSVEKEINHDYSRLPVFAGTFWEKTTAAYVKANVDRVVLKGEAQVNGVVTKILELTVPKADKFKAFGGVNEVIEGGGLLRLYVAPEWGFVLPRIEHVGNDGQVAAKYDAFGFRESSPGLFLPKRCEFGVYVRGESMTSVFTLTKIARINDPIPDAAFKILLPIQTLVADSRGRQGSVEYTIEKAGAIPADGLDDIVRAGSFSFWSRSLPTAIGLGVNGGFVVTPLAYMIRKHGAKSPTP